MPQIAQYTAPQSDTLQPNDAPEQAFQQAARRLGSLGIEESEGIKSGAQAITAGLNSVNEGATTLGKVVERHAEQHEILTGFSNLVKTNEALTKNQQDFLKANADDPLAMEKWKQQVLNPTIQAFTSSFDTEGGQKWAAEHGATIATEFARHGTAIMQNLAAQKVESTIKEGVNSMSNQVRQNPALLDMNLGMIDKTFAEFANQPNLTPEVQAKVKEALTADAKKQLVYSAAQGLGARSAASMSQILDNPAYAKYITPTEAIQLQHAQRTYENGEKADDRSARILDNYLRQERKRDAEASITANYTQVSPDGDSIIFKPGYVKALKGMADAGIIPPSELAARVENAKHGQQDIDKAAQALTYQKLGEGLLNTDPGAPGRPTPKDIEAATLTPRTGISRAQADSLLKFNKSLDDPHVQTLVAAAKDTIKATILEKVLGHPATQADMAKLGDALLTPQGSEAVSGATAALSAAMQSLAERGMNPALAADPNAPEYFAKNGGIGQYWDIAATRRAGGPAALQEYKNNQLDQQKKLKDAVNTLNDIGNLPPGTPKEVKNDSIRQLAGPNAAPELKNFDVDSPNAQTDFVKAALPPEFRKGFEDFNKWGFAVNPVTQQVQAGDVVRFPPDNYKPETNAKPPANTPDFFSNENGPIAHPGGNQPTERATGASERKENIEVGLATGAKPRNVDGQTQIQISTLKGPIWVPLTATMQIRRPKATLDQINGASPESLNELFGKFQGSPF